MEGWSRVTISDIATEVTVGHVGSMADDYEPTGIPFLRSLNVEPFKLRMKDVKFISHAFHNRLRKSALAPGDVVIVRTGKPGACTVIPDQLREANCSDLVIVRCSERVRPHFLSYVVNALAGHHIAAHTVGAVQQHFNVGSARTLAFQLPPLSEQDEILDVLRTLDDKIELNRRMNETLEASTRALFRDWFVDFGPTRAKAEGRPAYLAPDLWSLFPDRLGEDGVPEGWESFTVGDLTEHHTASINPGTAGEEVFEHYSLPAFDSGASPALDPGGSIKSNKTLVPAGAVLLSKLNPEISRVWVPNDVGILRQVASTEFLAFVPKTPASRSLLFALFRDDAFRQIMEGMVTGTSKSHQRISPPALRGVEAIVGSPASFQAFDKMVAPMVAETLRNRTESRTLAATRDALLPKLMSGELRVRDAEALAA